MRPSIWRAAFMIVGCTPAFVASCGRIGFDPLRDRGGSLGSDVAGSDADATTTPGSAGSRADAGSRGGAGGARAEAGTDAGAGARGARAEAGTDAGGAGGSRGDSGATASGGRAPDGGTPSVSVLVSPNVATVLVGQRLQFRAEVTGDANTAVSWSVAEGPSGGAISGTGEYTAPASPGVYRVVVASTADASKQAFARVTVSLPASAGFGTWQDVTPAGVDPSKDWGIADVVVDPVRPSDLYVFVCLDGVWKSTDFGLTWGKVSTGAGASVLEKDCASTLVIERDPLRAATTPPALYTGDSKGYWPGVEKSTDGGVSWTNHPLPKSTTGNVEGIDVDPYDSRHLIVSSESGGGFSESLDAGETWTAVGGPPAAAGGVDPHFVDTGIPSTTRRTWLVVSAGGGTVDGPGTWRTADAGAHWTQVDTFGHGAGSSQLFEAGEGRMFTGGQYGKQGGANTLGIYASTDYGSSWSMIWSGSANGAIGTPSYLYSWNDWANPGGIFPGMKRAPRAAATPWTSVTTPAGMTNGPRHAAVTYDGSHYVIVGGCWNAGIFRYVEP